MTNHSNNMTIVMSSQCMITIQSKLLSQYLPTPIMCLNIYSLDPCFGASSIYFMIFPLKPPLREGTVGRASYWKPGLRKDIVCCIPPVIVRKNDTHVWGGWNQQPVICSRDIRKKREFPLWESCFDRLGPSMFLLAGWYLCYLPCRCQVFP